MVTMTHSSEIRVLFLMKLSCETLQIFFKNPNSFSIISIGPHKEEDERVYHSYYQWVPLVLSIQAIFFYAPHWIWKQLEGGRLEVCFDHIDPSPP